VTDFQPKVVVDTNVWISAFISRTGPAHQVLEAFRADRFDPVISRALIEEIREVLIRARIRRRWQFSGDEIQVILARLEDRATVADPTGEYHVCRDPDDDILLETALVGGARYFVSRDDDIKRDLDLVGHLRDRGVEVLSVAQFLSLLASQSS
jgi:putative PIN family toxin of toxin-antitoxin system